MFLHYTLYSDNLLYIILWIIYYCIVTSIYYYILVYTIVWIKSAFLLVPDICRKIFQVSGIYCDERRILWSLLLFAVAIRRTGNKTRGHARQLVLKYTITKTRLSRYCSEHCIQPVWSSIDPDAKKKIKEDYICIAHDSWISSQTIKVSVKE